MYSQNVYQNQRVLRRSIYTEPILTSREECNAFKVARCSFKSGSISPKFEHKLRRHKQRFGKIAATVVSDKDENLL